MQISLVYLALHKQGILLPSLFGEGL